MYLFFLILIATVGAIEKFNEDDIPSKAHVQFSTDESVLLWPWRTYRTCEHTPPHMEVKHFKGPKLAPGYIFMAPGNANGNDGTVESGTGYIFDHEGDLVYAAEQYPQMNFCGSWVSGMTDFRAQMYNGKRHITYWNGCNHKGAHWGHRWGRVTFIDEEYSNFTINPDLGIHYFDDAPVGQIGNHEHEMTDRNTMVVTSYNNTQHSLEAIDGPADAWVADGMFFEIDVKTQEVVYEWRALDHLDMHDSRFSFNGPGAGVTERVPWDWLHINSVQRVGDNYLISARHHWALYYINGKDGSVIWKLDGITGGDFGSIPETFRWQHHARAYNVTDEGMTVSLFNNMVNGKKTKKFQTQGLAFWLPMPASKDRPPVLVKRMETPSRMLFTGTQGSYQMDLGNGDEFGKGNGFVGYGLIPWLREYGPKDDGSQLLWQAQFGEEKAVMNYRGFKSEWRGTPKHWDPILVFEDPRTVVPHAYVSWNGATDITGWAVFAGDSKDSLESIGVAKKMAFETMFDLEKYECVQVGAIRDGEIIRKSNVACLGESQVAGGNSGVQDYSQEEIDRIEKEKAELEALKKELEGENAELEDETWAAYRLFAEVALAVILVVLGAWVYVLWRDWRRRSQYASVPDSELGPLGLGLRLPRWQRSTKKSEPSDRTANAAAEYDERRLDDETPTGEREKDMDVDHFDLADDDDEDQPNSTQPFIK